MHRLTSAALAAFAAISITGPAAAMTITIPFPGATVEDFEGGDLWKTAEHTLKKKIVLKMGESVTFDMPFDEFFLRLSRTFFKPGESVYFKINGRLESYAWIFRYEPNVKDREKLAATGNEAFPMEVKTSEVHKRFEITNGDDIVTGLNLFVTNRARRDLEITSVSLGVDAGSVLTVSTIPAPAPAALLIAAFACSGLALRRRQRRGEV